MKDPQQGHRRERERELMPLPAGASRERDIQPRDRDRERRERDSQRDKDQRDRDQRDRDMNIIRAVAFERQARAQDPNGANSVASKMRLAEAAGVGVGFVSGIGGFGKGALGEVREREHERDAGTEREKAERDGGREREGINDTEMFVPPHTRPSHHTHSHSHPLQQAHGPPLALSHLNPNRDTSNPPTSAPITPAQIREQQALAAANRDGIVRESLYDKSQPQFQFQTQFQVRPIAPNAPGGSNGSPAPDAIDGQRDTGRFAYRELPIPFGPPGGVNGNGTAVPKALGNTIQSLEEDKKKWSWSWSVGPKAGTVSLGTFVWPRTPFPYFFSEVYPKGEGDKENAETSAMEKSKGKSKPNGKEKEKEGKGEGDEVSAKEWETKAVIYIPSGHLPSTPPRRPRLWGGGLTAIEAQRQHHPQHNSNHRPRRIYTDDSDLILCVVHSGFIRWSAIMKAKAERKDLKVEVGLVRVSGRGLGGALGVGRFIGGMGERYWCGEGDGLGIHSGGGEEDDGRGLMSAGWGSEHDGSGIEILAAGFVDKGTVRSSPALGRRNRSQRLAEYGERRTAVLGSVVADINVGTRFGLGGGSRKRRRILAPSKLPQEEFEAMGTHTVVFGLGTGGDVRPG